RPWHQLWLGRLKEFGVKLSMPSEASSAYEGKAYLTRIALSRLADEAVDSPAMHNLQRSPDAPQAGRVVEYSFGLTHPMRQPFDRSDVDLLATITTPDNRTVTSRLFYKEDFTY